MIQKLVMKTLASSVVLALFLGCGSIQHENKNIVGDNLVLAPDMFNPVINISKATLQAGFDAEAQAAGTQAKQALLGIQSFKINYTTTDQSGKKVQASGLITIPALTAKFLTGYKEQNKKDFSLSIVSDQHGTIFKNDQSPTKVAAIGKPTSISAIFSGVAGFMTIQPDFIGYGDLNGSHPYILEKSLASATVDMIKASINFANRLGLPINGQVFLSGYSEGGYATMATAKEIQENHPNINLKAVAPMAGPYNVETMVIGSLMAPIMPFPPFLAFIVNSYANAYDDVNINEVVNAPYATMLNSLFDGTHSGLEIYASLPNLFSGDFDGQNPDKLFVPTYSDDFIVNSNNALRKRFAQNSTIDWAPKMPMHLYHCTNDLIIPYVMTTSAVDSFTNNGSTTVTAMPINGLENNVSNPVQLHGECALAAYAQVVPWFDSVRKGGN